MMFTCPRETAVVILSYKSKTWHEQFLPDIVAEAGNDYKVYLVDHASPDNTAEYIKAHFPEVQLISLKENHGFAWGYDQALRQIKAKYFVLLSSDFEVTPQWFPPLLSAMEANPHWSACQPKVRFFRDKALFEYAGAAGGFMDKWGYMFCRGRIFDTLEEDKGQYDTPANLFWASGGCMMVRSEVYTKVGGLDSDFFAHMEEIDLCWRMKNAGYSIGYVPDSTVFHVGGAVITYGSPQKTYYNFRNNLILLLKNDEAKRLLWLIPLRLLLDGIAGLQFLLSGKFKNFWAIIRAHNHFIRGIGLWMKKRKLIQPLVTERNKAGTYPKSILVQYFLKGRKKFSDLNFPV